MPILYIQLGNLQHAVDETYRFLTVTVESFERTSKRIEERFSGSDEKTREDLHAFIEGCQFYCTGNLSWRQVLLTTCISLMMICRTNSALFLACPLEDMGFARTILRAESKFNYRLHDGDPGSELEIRQMPWPVTF